MPRPNSDTGTPTWETILLTDFVVRATPMELHELLEQPSFYGIPFGYRTPMDWLHQNIHELKDTAFIEYLIELRLEAGVGLPDAQILAFAPGTPRYTSAVLEAILEVEHSGTFIRLVDTGLCGQKPDVFAFSTPGWEDSLRRRYPDLLVIEGIISRMKRLIR